MFDVANIPLPIIGENVIIRTLCEFDLDELYALETDTAVKAFLGGPVTRPREVWIEGMRKLLDQQYAVTSKCTREFAGCASLTVPGLPGKESEIRVLIAKSYWGQQLGREVCQLLIGVAFSHLEASSVLAVIHPNNNASKMLVTSLGFRCIQTKQSETWDNGHLIFSLEHSGELADS